MMVIIMKERVISIAKTNNKSMKNKRWSRRKTNTHTQRCM